MEEKDSDKVTNGQLVLTIGMAGIMPLLMIGLLGQSIIALTQGATLTVLSLLAFFLGSGGLAFSFSEKKHGFNIGVALITVSAALSFLFEFIAVIPEGVFTIHLIMTSTFFALFLAVLDFTLRYDSKGNVTPRIKDK